MMNLFHLFTSRHVLPWSKKCSWQLKILYGRRSGFTVLNRYDGRKKVSVGRIKWTKYPLNSNQFKKILSIFIKGTVTSRILKFSQKKKR